VIRPLSGVALAVALLALGRCSTFSADTGGVDAHLDGEGPLGGGVTHPGSQSLFEPKQQPKSWDATFGLIWPCAAENATPVLDAVSYTYGVEPVRTITTVRTSRTGGSEQDAPTGSLQGDPRELPGRLDRTVKGLEVTHPCGSSNGSREFTEVLATMVVDKRGGSITSAAVDYHVGDKKYRLEVPWTYVACGSATEDTRLC
jgi:hypothetical protein